MKIRWDFMWVQNIREYLTHTMIGALDRTIFMNSTVEFWNIESETGNCLDTANINFDVVSVDAGKTGTLTIVAGETEKMYPIVFFQSADSFLLVIKIYRTRNHSRQTETNFM